MQQAVEGTKQEARGSMGASPIAILCNGPSLEDHAKAGNLKRIPCETIGVNRSWEVMGSSYHVMIDTNQWGYYKRITGQGLDTIRNLYTGKHYTGGDVPPSSATHLNVQASDMPKFSFDPMKIAWLCGTVTWVALQLAVGHLNANPIYFFGLDLMPRGTNGKFWGGTWDPNMEARQRELFGYAQGYLGMCLGIEMANVVMNENHTRCHAFPKRRFEEVFR
jgi:hypothetical protein